MAMAWPSSEQALPRTPSSSPPRFLLPCPVAPPGARFLAPVPPRGGWRGALSLGIWFSFPVWQPRLVNVRLPWAPISGAGVPLRPWHPRRPPSAGASNFTSVPRPVAGRSRPSACLAALGPAAPQSPDSPALGSRGLEKGGVQVLGACSRAEG